MQIVIDISEDVYTRLFDNGIQDNEIAVDDVCKMIRALRLGIPLEECDDCVSRQAVLDKESYTETEEGWSGFTVDVDDIKALVLNAEQRWRR